MSHENKIKVLTVVGPTASGKTALAVALAKIFDGEIVSADSMQIYKEMNIATAKPNDEEKQGVVHHLMDFLPPSEIFSVADYVKEAKSIIEDINKRGKLPIIAGGTGLYVDSLLKGVKFTEEKFDPDLRERLNSEYREFGIEPLLEKLKDIDFESYQKLERERNPKRIIRALEIYETSGVTMSQQIKNSLPEDTPYDAVKIGLKCEDRQKLYDRINLRVDLMMEQGLLEETEKVLNKPLGATSVMAIGYKELAPYFKGEKSLEQCVEHLKQETRRYAKRQLTWFGRDKEIHWILTDKWEGFQDIVEQAENICISAGISKKPWKE